MCMHKKSTYEGYENIKGPGWSQSGREAQFLWFILDTVCFHWNSRKRERTFNSIETSSTSSSLVCVVVSLTNRLLRWTARRITPPTCPRLLTPAGEGNLASPPVCLHGDVAVSILSCSRCSWNLFEAFGTPQVHVRKAGDISVFGAISLIWLDNSQKGRDIVRNAW